MYSEDIEKICGLCVNSRPVKGIETHCACDIHGGYVPVSRNACDKFSYDIFKKKVHRQKLPVKKYDEAVFKLQ